jgi:hypothetical protein
MSMPRMGTWAVVSFRDNLLRLTQQGVLVGGGDDLEDLGLLVVALHHVSNTRPENNRHSTYEPAPARTLDGSGLGVDLLDEVVKRAKVLLDLLGKGARGGGLGRVRTGGGKVLPEELLG